MSRPTRLGSLTTGRCTNDQDPCRRGRALARPRRIRRRAGTRAGAGRSDGEPFITITIITIITTRHHHMHHNHHASHKMAPAAPNS